MGLNLLNMIDNNGQQTDNEQQVKKFTVQNGKITVNDPEIRKQIDKVKLSPSMVGSFIVSPGDWLVGKYIEPEVTKQEPVHLTRGTWFHEVLELFYQLEPAERTKTALVNILRNLTDNKYPEMNSDENRDWMRIALGNYIKNGLDNAPNEKVAKIYLQGELKTGLELFISGKIGNCQRMCLGFIDRLIEGKSGLIVEDWKTGKSISDYNPLEEPSEKNPFDYWRQQLFYTILLEQAGMAVESACLKFPVANAVVNVDVNNQKAREQVVKDCESVDLELTKCIEDNYTFPFRAGKYTTWAYYLGKVGTHKRAPEIHTDLLYKMVEVID